MCPKRTLGTFRERPLRRDETQAQEARMFVINTKIFFRKTFISKKRCIFAGKIDIKINPLNNSYLIDTEVVLNQKPLQWKRPTKC